MSLMIYSGKTSVNLSEAEKKQAKLDKRPFVDFSEEDKVRFADGEGGFLKNKLEKDTRVKTGVLGDALEDDDKVRMKKSEKNRPPSRQAPFLYHATTYKNLVTISKSGLDPARGGSKVGASFLADGDLKAKSIEGSKNYVHGATQSEVALNYAKKFDDREKNKNVTDRKGAGYAVILRFKVGDPADWTEDTEDKRGNYKTPEVVAVDDIEVLDIERGWIPLADIDRGILSALAEDESSRTGVVEERNLQSVNMTADGKYSGSMT